MQEAGSLKCSEEEKDLDCPLYTQGKHGSSPQH